VQVYDPSLIPLLVSTLRLLLHPASASEDPYQPSHRSKGPPRTCSAYIASTIRNPETFDAFVQHAVGAFSNLPTFLGNQADLLIRFASRFGTRRIGVRYLGRSPRLLRVYRGRREGKQLGRGDQGCGNDMTGFLTS
jgi:hypothetical protein